MKAKECQPEAFDQTFDSVSDCRDQTEPQVREMFDAQLAGCDYMPDKGRECIHTAYQHRKDCGDASSDFMEACAGVFVCPAGLEPDDDPMSTALEVVLAVPEP